MNRGKWILLGFEVACVLWMAIAGSMLHFAFELSDFWTPMALLGAVNESAWEHVKMYFWPGLFFALAQYTYTRHIANNYWLGKGLGLATMPAAIFVMYFGYMKLVDITGMQASLGIMIGMMFAGIIAGQSVSYYFLTRPEFETPRNNVGFSVLASLTLAFASLTYFPPKIFLFEHFYCYNHTGEYGILEDYEPYRVFGRKMPDGSAGANVNYCADTTTASAGSQAADQD